MGDRTTAFNELYGNRPDYYGLQPSDGLVSTLGKLHLTPARAIDIGCGTGRNSIWLSNQGWMVTAVDSSTAAITALLKNAGSAGARITPITKDILELSLPPREFRLIVAVTVLNNLPLDKLPGQIARFHDWLEPGGLVYSVSLSQEDPGFTGVPGLASECASLVGHYFAKNELKGLFSAFTLLEYREYTKEDTSHGPRHLHGKVKLIARK